MQIADQQDNKIQEPRNGLRGQASLLQVLRRIHPATGTNPVGARLAREEALTTTAEPSRCALTNPRHPLVRAPPPLD